MPIKKFVKDYLSFSRKDRLGLIALLILILIIYFLPYLGPKEQGYPVKEIPLLAKAIDSLNRKDSALERKPHHARSSGNFKDDYTKGALFRFDPNQLDAYGWKALGLSEKRVTTILNYRNKGGKFRKPEDLKKIWGLPPGFYERVSGYNVIEIPPEQIYSNPNPRYVKPE